MSWALKLFTSECKLPFTFTYPLTEGVVRAPQMTSKLPSSICLCSPLLSGTWRPLFLSVLSSLLFHTVPCKMVLASSVNGRHVHTTAVSVSLRWSGGLCVVRLPAASWQRLSRWQHGLCIRCVVSCGSASFFFFFLSLSLFSSVCAVLKSILGLEPSLDTTEPRYLKRVTVSSFCLFL